MRKNIILLPLLLILCMSLLSPRMDTSSTIDFSPVPMKNLHNAKIISSDTGNKMYTVKDLTYHGSSDPFITDMVLSFNAPSSRLSRDDMRHYRILSSDYNFIIGKGSLGKGCAQFFKKNHSVILETVKNAWLGTCEDLGSFTIEFRCKPYELRDGSILFSRIGFFSGIKRGIEITIKNNRIHTGLYGIFDRPDRKIYDVILNRGRELQKMKWYHFSVSFDRISGKLTSYINGDENEVMFVTESGEPFNGVYAPSFGYRTSDGKLQCLDSPQAFIGKDYSGLIDEFRISYRHFEELEKTTELAYKNYHSVGTIGRIPFNVEGVVESPVYEFNNTGTMVLGFDWQEQLPKDTFIWMQFRISDKRFIESDSAIKWYRVKKGQKKIFLMRQDDGSYLRGKYYQWRAHLISSPDGKHAPELSDIQLNYRLDVPPNPPQQLEVAAAGDRHIILKWRKNADHDILGYKIYYGTTPGRYDGIIDMINGKRITNSENAGSFMEVKITNDEIESNKMRDIREKLSYPILQNMVLYYFAVSAYDSYKPDTPYNHESELSHPVTARPYEGSEIK